MIFRLLSSAVILPAWVALMFKAPLAFRLIIFGCILIGAEEYRRLWTAKKLGYQPWLTHTALTLLLLPAALGPNLLPPGTTFHLRPLEGLWMMSLIFCTATASAIFRPREKDLPLRLLAEVLGVLYLAVPGLCIYALMGQASYGSWWVFLIFWYAWIYDAAALFVGKAWGRTKLNALSPAKTFEGLWGGMALTAVLSALILPLVLPQGFPFGRLGLALFALPASAMAQAGDLFESMLKRYAKVKDSSRLIKAHGGFLDKMDSSLFLAPLMLALAALAGWVR